MLPSSGEPYRLLKGESMSVASELEALSSAYNKLEYAKSNYDRLKSDEPQIPSESTNDVAILKEIANHYSQEIDAIVTGKKNPPSEQEKDAIIVARDALHAQNTAITSQQFKLKEARDLLDDAEKKANEASVSEREAFQAEEKKLHELQKERDRFVGPRDSKIAKIEQERFDIQQKLKELPSRNEKSGEHYSAQLNELEKKCPTKPNIKQVAKGWRPPGKAKVIAIVVAVLGLLYTAVIDPLQVSRMGVIPFLLMAILVPIAIGYGIPFLREVVPLFRLQMADYRKAYSEWESKKLHVDIEKTELEAKREAEQSELSQRLQECEAEIEKARLANKSQIDKIESQIQAQEKIYNKKKAEADAVSSKVVCAAQISTWEAEKAKLEALKEEKAKLEDRYCLSLNPILAQLKEEAEKSYQQKLNQARAILNDRERSFNKARKISKMGSLFPLEELENLPNIIKKINSGRASTVSEALQLLDQEEEAERQQIEFEKAWKEQVAESRELCESCYYFEPLGWNEKFEDYACRVGNCDYVDSSIECHRWRAY